jgi:hypothetical protein
MKLSKPAAFVIGFLAGLVLIGALAFLFFLLPPSRKPLPQVPAVSTVITAPPIEPTTAPSPSPIAAATLPEGVPPDPGATITVGITVKISGTEGQGLRLRREPGKDSTPIFLGAENEVFEVVDGPSSADGFNWWYLKAPADSTRQGWAVANYLLPVQ